MPIDCAPTTPWLLVRNHAGIVLPFAHGTLATSLLVSGIPTPMAYRIADRVTGDLRAHERREVQSQEIVERATEALEELVGSGAAERFVAWREAKLAGLPLVLCLLGAPGIGKSTMATRLALRLAVSRIVPTDAIRETLRTVVPSSAAPELHLAAHEAASGADRSDGMATAFVRQANAVGSAAVAVAERVVQEGRSVLLHGTHLMPGAMQEQLAARGCRAIVIEVLLVLGDERLHRAQMLRRTRSDPARPGSRHLEQFEAIRELQTALQQRARQAGVLWYDLANPEGLTEWIVDHYVAATHRRGALAPARLS